MSKDIQLVLIDIFTKNYYDLLNMTSNKLKDDGFIAIIGTNPELAHVNKIAFDKFKFKCEFICCLENKYIRDNCVFNTLNITVLTNMAKKSIPFLRQRLILMKGIMERLSFQT